MTFEQFQATRKWSDNLATSVPADFYFGDMPGQVYAESLYIEAAEGIEGATGEYLLTIGNHQKFGELEALERDLYDFAVSEGIIE